MDIANAPATSQSRMGRPSLFAYVIGARPLVALTAPVIYSLIVVFALADLWVSAYQAICFRAYGVRQVERHQYFRFDRARLPYLNALERFNCIYCSYVNGVIAYVREVAARTEQYWCPIKHTQPPVDAHPRYEDFANHDADAGGYDAHLAELRALLRDDSRPAHQQESESNAADLSPWGSRVQGR